MFWVPKKYILFWAIGFEYFQRNFG